MREDVRSLLREQARGLTVVPRRFVNCLRLFPSQNLSAHRAIADHHRHVIHRGILWQGERVDGFNLFFERIFELLRNRHARKKAADLRLHIRVFQRADGFRIANRIDSLQRALGDFLVLSGDDRT